MTKPTAGSIERWLEDLPDTETFLFWPPPKRLYCVKALYEGLDPAVPSSWRRAWDTKVFQWTLGADAKPRMLNDVETVATRLHDAAMDRLVRDFIDHDRCVTVGFMGGHDVLRTAPAYLKVARIARTLRRRDFKIVTGGGPGLMEAANLGALLAPHSDEDFDGALDILRTAPSYKNSADLAAERERQDWIATAAKVREKLLNRWDAEPRAGGESLGIPTWYYGSEPPNLFASVSGKYFMNSLREDGLVSLANGGLIFGQGSAGTVQEVFQNANYNVYRGVDENGVILDATPMVFLGVDFWNPGPPSSIAAGAGALEDPAPLPVYPLVQALAAAASHPFMDSLLLSDDPDTIAAFLNAQNAHKRRPTRHADQVLEGVNALTQRR